MTNYSVAIFCFAASLYNALVVYMYPLENERYKLTRLANIYIARVMFLGALVSLVLTCMRHPQ